MTATITWFLASAAAAAFLDIAQVARATGGEPVLRLAAMVVTLYLLAGAATGIAAAMCCCLAWDWASTSAARLVRWLYLSDE